MTRAPATHDPAPTTAPAERPARDLIAALLLAPASTKLGPAWRALVLSGHEAGRETLVFAEQVREARPYQDPPSTEAQPALAGA